MKVSAILVTFAAALVMAAPAVSDEAAEVQALEARALAQDAAAVDELVARQIWTCNRCSGGKKLCCGLTCATFSC